MQTNEKVSPSEQSEEFYIVSSELLNWMRGIAFTKLTMQDVEGKVDELWACPTIEQYLELREAKKPKIIT
ncbi:hypothetical protein N9064_01130 [bacterium]|jgi:hypothetical protein|nr:hypothetical protein [bacterium]